MAKAHIVVKTKGSKKAVVLHYSEGSGIKSEVTSGEFTGLYARDGAYAIDYGDVPKVITIISRINRPLRKNKKVEGSDIRDLDNMLHVSKRS